MNPAIRTLPFVASISLVALFGNCRSSDEDASKVNSEFESIQPPPANSLLPVVSGRVDSAHSSIRLIPNAASAPHVFVLRNGKPLNGDSVFDGTISSTTPNVITFTQAQHPPISIGIALPKGLKLTIPENVNGRLSIQDRSSPVGADMMVSIQDEGSLLVGFIWRVSRNPISFDLGRNVRILQDPAGVGAVRASITIQQGKKPLTLGSPLPFKVGTRNYVAYLHTSLYQKGSPSGESQGYVLRAIIVRE